MMRIQVTHTIDFPRPRVEDAILNDPALDDRLASLPDVANRQLVSKEVQPDGSVDRVVRYEFGGSIPGAVKAAIGTDQIIWDEHAHWNPDSHTFDVRIEPHVARDKFSASGTITLTENGTATDRTADLDLQVKVPIVGRLVEMAIRDGLGRALAAEADAINEHLK